MLKKKKSSKKKVKVIKTKKKIASKKKTQQKRKLKKRRPKKNFQSLSYHLNQIKKLIIELLIQLIIKQKKLKSFLKLKL